MEYPPRSSCARAPHGTAAAVVALSCLMNGALRVDVDAATYRRTARERGPIAALELHAARSGRPLEWVEGVTRASHGRDELALVVVFMGYATMTRPLDEADKEKAKAYLARLVLEGYLVELDQFEAELAATKAKLPKHLRGSVLADPPPPPVKGVTPIPAGGLRDLFTGEVRAPVYPDEPAPSRPPQRRLL